MRRCSATAALLSFCLALVGNCAVGDGGGPPAPFYQQAKEQARLLPLRPRGERQIKIDGKLDDWGDLREDSFPLHQLLDHGVPDFHQSWKQQWESEPIDAALVKLIYDQEALYVAVQVADDSVISPAGDKRFQGDVVDLYLDLRPLVGPGPVTGHVKYTEGMYQMVFAPPAAAGEPLQVLQPDNDLVTGWRAGQKVPRLGPVQAAGSLVAGGYVIEARFPLASFPHGPPADRLSSPVGIEVMIADLDAQRAKGRPDRMYYSCSGYSGGANFFKCPATIACTDPELRTALPLSRLRPNPRRQAPGGDEPEGWIVTALDEKDVDAAYRAASKAVLELPGPAAAEAAAGPAPLTTYRCPALGIAFHHHRVLSRLPASAPACVGNRYFPVFPTAGRPVKVDGNLDEWDDLLPHAPMIYEYGCLPYCGCLPGRTDSAAIVLRSDPQTLYVAVRVRDDSVINPGQAAKRFAGDCVQVFLDVRSPNAETNPLSTGTYSDGAYHFYVAPPTADGQPVAFMQGPEQVRRAGSITSAAVAEQGGYAVELAIPLASVLAAPAPGRFQQPFGFEVLVTDLDAGGKPGEYVPLVHYSWSGSFEDYLHGQPSFFNCADYVPNRLPEVRALVDATPATIMADFAHPGYAFSGFGGNYRRDGALTHLGGKASQYAPTAATTRYVARNLHNLWARTNLYLFEWEWVKDNDSPDEMDPALPRFLTTEGKPGHVHEKDCGPPYKALVDGYLKLAKEWAGPETKLCVYANNLPGWLFPDDLKQAVAADGCTIPRRLWPEYAECVGSYLTYAKKQYGIEVALFSLEDPHYGRLQFTPAAYPEFLKCLGRYFTKHGLATKLLLCETGQVNDFRWYLDTLADKEVRPYLGGLGLTITGPLGPQMANYRLWRDLAAQYDQPLIISSFGRPYVSSPTYLFEEIRLWQQLVREVGPTAAMLEQFISDRTDDKLALVRGREVITNAMRGVPSLQIVRLAEKEEDVVPTQRFYVTKQFCDLTPTGSIIPTTSTHPEVLVTGFTGTRDGRPADTLHLANAGPRRQATVSGLPARIKRLRVVRTGSGEGFQEAGEVAVKNGELSLELPAWSLVTLTTVAPRPAR